MYGSIFKGVTSSFFNTISIMTTTGFTLHDYELWPPLSQLVIFFLFFVGGMAGSTSGGIKIIRTILVIKYIRTEISRMLHPRGLQNIKIDNNTVSDDVIRNTMGFYLFYILIFGVCSLLFAINGMDILSSISASASSIGNIGPGLEAIGPTNDWGGLNNFSKYLATFCMLLGRLEIFTVIVLFSKTYWKS
jgi:trk system potassium uptake protein TrkH